MKRAKIVITKSHAFKLREPVEISAGGRSLLAEFTELYQIETDFATPLTEAARDLLNREMKSGIDVEKLVELVLSLHEEDRLCVAQDDAEAREPKIICSLGIAKEPTEP